VRIQRRTRAQVLTRWWPGCMFMQPASYLQCPLMPRVGLHAGEQESTPGVAKVRRIPAGQRFQNARLVGRRVHMAPAGQCHK
jgi:hypothetical protein